MRHHLLLSLALFPILLAACDSKAKVDAVPTQTTVTSTTAPESQQAGSDSLSGDLKVPVKQEPALAKGTYAKLTLEDVRARAVRLKVAHPPEGAGDERTNPIPGKLAHEAFRGRIGPFPDASIHVNSLTPGPVIWILAEQDGAMHAWSPTVDDYVENEVQAIFFEDLGQDGSVEALVLYRYMLGAGPQGAQDLFDTLVLEWDAEQGIFTHNEEISQTLHGMETASQVKASLKKSGHLR